MSCVAYLVTRLSPREENKKAQSRRSDQARTAGLEQQQWPAAYLRPELLARTAAADLLLDANRTHLCVGKRRQPACTSNHA